jgi:UDP-N-acetylglucosamine 2-epimerase
MVTCHINEERIFVTGSHVVMRDALEETKKKNMTAKQCDGKTV